MKFAVEALAALKVAVVAIPDFDIIQDVSDLRGLVTAFGLSWLQISESMQTILDCLNANDGKDRDYIKKHGSSALSGKAPAVFYDVDGKLRAIGLLIVPIGEIECFDTTISKLKKDWVYAVLERGNLGSDDRLEPARKFVMAIIDFMPQICKDHRS